MSDDDVSTTPSCCSRSCCSCSETSLVGAVFNLANSAVGTGILFLPFVLNQAGFFLGMCFITFGAMLCSFTLYLLHKDYEIVSKLDSTIEDYEQLGGLAYGKCISFFMQFCIFIINLGVLIAFVIVVSDLLKSWVSNEAYHALLLLGVITPSVLASLSHRVANLSFISYFSMGLILTFASLVVVAYATGVTEKARAGSSFEVVPDFTKIETYTQICSVLGVVVFAFECHTSLLPISREFAVRSRYKIGVGVFLAIFMVWLLYAAVAGFGYLSFLGNTKSDLISSYEGEGWAQNALRVILLIAILTTYPFVSFPARLAMNHFLKDVYKYVLCRGSAHAGIMSSNEDETIELLSQQQSSTEEEEDQYSPDSPDPEAVGPKKKKKKNGRTPKVVMKRDHAVAKNRCEMITDIIMTIVTTFTLALIAYLFAIFYPHAADVFGLVGSTATTCTSYVFPCLLYLKLAKPKWYSCRAIGVGFVMVFGIVFGLVATGMKLYTMIDNAVESRGEVD